MKDGKDKTQEGDGVVTEAALLKSLQTLEGKKVEEETKPAEKPVVATAPLKKSAGDIIREKSSVELRKNLDVSASLAEIVSLLGAHVDESLQAMAKSVNAAAQRDLAIVGCFEQLKKSIDGLGEQIKTFGEKPAAGAKSATSDGKVETVPLAKSVTDEAKQSEKPRASRSEVVSVFSKLAKSADVNTDDNRRWTRAAVKMETTGEASDADLKVAMDEINKKAA